MSLVVYLTSHRPDSVTSTMNTDMDNTYVLQLTQQLGSKLLASFGREFAVLWQLGRNGLEG